MLLTCNNDILGLQFYVMSLVVCSTTAGSRRHKCSTIFWCNDSSHVHTLNTTELLQHQGNGGVGRDGG